MLTAYRYTIKEVIGKGSYGVVCSAIDNYTGEKVAIKKINNVFEHVSDATRILREIKLLRLLKHPGQQRGPAPQQLTASSFRLFCMRAYLKIVYAAKARNLTAHRSGSLQWCSTQQYVQHPVRCLQEQTLALAGFVVQEVTLLPAMSSMPSID